MKRRPRRNHTPAFKAKAKGNTQFAIGISRLKIKPSNIEIERLNAHSSAATRDRIARRHRRPISWSKRHEAA
jgi:hypothetical protein